MHAIILNTIITHLWVLPLCGEDVETSLASVMSITLKVTPLTFNLYYKLIKLCDTVIACGQVMGNKELNWNDLTCI